MKWASIICVSIVLSFGCKRRAGDGPDAGVVTGDPAARTSSALAYDERRGETIMFGGHSSGTDGGGATDLADTWGWNGAEWASINATPSKAPLPRKSHVMAYDAARGVTVLFSGLSGFVGGNDTWEWDGEEWSFKSVAKNAPERFAAAMAYNSDRHTVQMFGGESASQHLARSDLWEWDGTKWAELTPGSGRPSARTGHGMAYDSTRQRLVLFGGCCRSSDETWEWNGRDWLLATPEVSPPARFDFAMAYDTERKVTTIFGGFSDVPHSDTWEWNGRVWTDVSPATGAVPPVSAGARMVYDSARHVQVLYGGLIDNGRNPGKESGETWEWDGTSWTRVGP